MRKDINLLRISVIHLICFLLSGFILNAQREIQFRRVMAVRCANPTYHINRCDYSLLVPANKPGKQQVLEYKYSVIKPNNVMKSGNEYYLQWKNLSFSELQNCVLEVSMKVKISSYDLFTAKLNPVIDKTDLDTLQYLKSEENFRTGAKKVKEAAAKITGNTREDIVREIFDFTRSALDYQVFFFQDRGVKQALKDGRGDCTEYSELMITLCRAKKIPARIVMGAIPGSNGIVGYHNWVEVFFPQYGWVAFDPTWADSPKSRTTFYSMRNTYIQMSNKRFVENIHTSCVNSDFPFSIALRDTCFELTRNTGKIVADMYKHFSGNEFIKASSLLDTLLSFDADNPAFLRLKALSLARSDVPEEAIKYALSAAENSDRLYEKEQSLYTLAVIYALNSKPELCVKALKEAVAAGFSFFEQVFVNKDFDKVKDDPLFAEYVNELKVLRGKQKN